MNDWLPIESAPKDGSYCLLFFDDCPVWDGNMEVGMWCGDCWWGCGGPNGNTELGLFSSHHGENPTHWMPLPEPPEPK